VTDDDITRKRLARHDAQIANLEAGQVHLLGINNQPGRIAGIEGDVKELQVGLAAEQVLRRETEKANEARFSVLEMSTARILWTIGAGAGIATALVAIALELFHKYG
jgi:hypothetical protein